MAQTTTFTFGEKFRSIFALFILAIVFISAGLLVALINLLTWGVLNNWLINTFGKTIGVVAFFLMGIKREIIFHAPLPDEPAVYIFNHTSTLDIPITLSVGLKSARYVAKYELIYNPVFGIIGLATGQVFINRGTSEKAVKSLKRAYERVIRKKLSLVIAPEGTRKHEDRVGKFKKGAFHTAKDIGYPIVPLYYENSFNLSPSSSLFFKSGTITIHVNPPISTKDWTNENLDEKVNEVRELYVGWTNTYDGDSKN
ncbi:1-acyl-sn-glycerol-3-phosphate acyltransferase [bacterium]|nr:MAG: 1-acyl-sn-glycerol-3-phosphate acyltransferase [bacterium]